MLIYWLVNCAFSQTSALSLRRSRRFNNTSILKNTFAWAKVLNYLALLDLAEG
jgi:hypothetical protein